MAQKKGYKHTEESKRKMSLAHIGKIPKHFKEFQEKAWEANRKRKGEKSHAWKGNDVGYLGIHVWISKQLGKPTKCSNCDKDGLTGRKIHWANKSKNYKRDVEDWIRLCVSCHWKYDQPYLNRERDVNGKFI